MLTWAKTYEVYVCNGLTGDRWVPEGSSAPVGDSAETVMNPSVADTKRYNSLYEATDEVNGIC